MALYTVTNLLNNVVVPPPPFARVFQSRETKQISAPISEAENASVLAAISAGLISITSANDPSFPDSIEGGAAGSAGLDAGSVGTTALATGAVTTAKLADDAVTAAKALTFVSAGQTATGASQNVAHGLGAVPAMVLVSVTAGHDGAGGAGTQMATVVEGSHTSTNVVVTVTAGATFKVLAWA